MKSSFPARAIAYILASMLLFSGCSSSKLNTPGAENAGIGTSETELTQTEAGETTSNSAAQDNTADNTNNTTDNTNNTAGDTAADSAQEQTAGAAEEQTAEAPVKAKALYLTGWTVGSSKRVDHYVELANKTEINSYVVDIKDDDGFVGYESQLPEVQANGTWKKKYNADSVIKAFHDNEIYIIGRIVAFKDPVYSVKRPDLAIKSVGGGLWKDNAKLTWLNPYNKENWEYLISIAKEAVEKGFDEIQFDYVRFPSDGKKKNMDFSGTEQEKYQAICEFLSYAKAQIPQAPISADVFGIILESPADTEGIGQYLEYIGKDVDYISPMAYPSHYAYGQIVNKVKFDAPDLDPYGVVYNTLLKGKGRIEQVSGYKAKVRPYLQDFTASWLRPKNMYQEYAAEQVRQQIKAVYDAGYEEWILWDAGNSYHEDALLPEEAAS